MIRKSLLTAVVMAMIYLPTWAHATTYYVNNNGGSNGNNGQSTGAAWETLAHAASQISSGDIVYVKASPFAYGSFTVADSGVSFIGYNSTTTDLNGGSGMPADYSEIINTGAYRGHPEPLEVTNCPRIDGGNRNSGTAVTISGKGTVIFKNFWVYNAQNGIYISNSSYCSIENVYVFNCGGRNNSNWYDGRGIELANGCTQVYVTNCMSYNTGHVAFNIVGSDANVIEYSQALCDDDEYGFDCNTHYYFDIANNSDNNEIYACIARRLHDPTAMGDDTLEHQGHGFALQAWDDEDDGSYTCSGNTIEACESYDISDAFLLRGPATGNEIVACTSICNEGEELDINSYSNGMYGGIALNAGPIDNLFKSVRVINANFGLLVLGSSDVHYDQTSTAGVDNIFHNCIFECNEIGINLHEWPEVINTFDDNGFLNCNFIAMKNGASFFGMEREASGNLIVNCIIEGFDDYANGAYESDPIGFSAAYCLMSDNVGFSSAFTTGNDTTGDPGFVDLDWNIDSASDARDAGTNISTYGTTDYDGDSRDGTYDIGAQEYVAP